MSTSDVHLMENRLRWIYEYYENKKYHGGVSVDYMNTGILDGIRRLLDGWPDAQASDLGAMTDRAVIWCCLIACQDLRGQMESEVPAQQLPVKVLHTKE